MKKKKKFFIILLFFARDKRTSLPWTTFSGDEAKTMWFDFSVADKHTSLLISQSMEKKKSFIFFLPDTKTPTYFIPHLVTNEKERHDTHHNDTQHNGTQHNGIRHNNPQHNNNLTLMVSGIMLSVAFYFLLC
jgi:hypothetical protein